MIYWLISVIIYYFSSAIPCFSLGFSREIDFVLITQFLNPQVAPSNGQRLNYKRFAKKAQKEAFAARVRPDLELEVKVLSEIYHLMGVM